MSRFSKRKALDQLQIFMDETLAFIGLRRFGSATDYTEFEADGTMKSFGNATTFDDLVGSSATVKVVGVGVTINDAEQTIDFATNADLNDYLWTSGQMRHRWKSGSNIGPHIHAEQTSSAVPNLLVRYRWRKNGAAKVTAWTDYVCNTPVYTYVSGTLDQIYYGAGITPPVGYGLSDIIQIRVYRDNANVSTRFAGADPINAVVSVTSVDTHIESDTLGSRTEFTK